MTHRSLVRLALVCVALATAACTTTMRKAPNYAERMQGVHKIGVMPPKATATLIVFKGDNENMPEVVAHTSPELVQAVTAAIRQYDYLVQKVVVVAPEEPLLVVAEVNAARPKPAADANPPEPAPREAVPLDQLDPNKPLTTEQVTTPETPPPAPPEEEPDVTTVDSPDLRFAATQAQGAADEAMNEMFKDPRWYKSSALNYKRSLGPQVNQFADMVDGEALMFMRYSYVTKSGGEIAKDITFSVLLAVATLGNVMVVQDVTAARLDVCLVDGATGDVLFANTASVSLTFGQPSAAGLVQAAMDGFNPHEK